jgi:hypothetical protein
MKKVKRFPKPSRFANRLGLRKGNGTLSRARERDRRVGQQLVVRFFYSYYQTTCFTVNNSSELQRTIWTEVQTRSV